ncbi:histone deacetylase [Candidatus Cyanaurora vandensis]|uniref:histone deacetylase family protein n=1 Tax=Candidatus Cyanaurora vandensis TaxID=2714958 RepID=UPI00257A638A|nr:histone deacetylase [Candidatus Cyanaurora vandensis]
MVAVVYSDEFLKHITGRVHPESPARVQVCAESLRELPSLHWLAPRPATMTELTWVHKLEYINLVAAMAQRGGGRLDADTPVSPASYEVALLSAGAWLVGMERVLAGEPTLVIARPPGHHARPSTGMGFCIFGNAALAAYFALHQGCQRVAILDWDVHHGNGTQEMVQADSRIAFCSLHQDPAYPGTGAATERGDHGNVLNLPLAPGSDGAVYRQVFTNQVEPFLRAFAPEVLIISAGFDANRADPLAQMLLEPADYGYFTERCRTLTDHILVGLEGGYDLGATRDSIVAVAKALLV